MLPELETISRTGVTHAPNAALAHKQAVNAILIVGLIRDFVEKSNNALQMIAAVVAYMLG